MAKHLTKEEILQRMNHVRMAKEASSKSASVCISTICFYVLIKNEKLSRNEISKISIYINEHFEDDIDVINKHLHDIVGWGVELEDDEPIVKSKNDFWNKTADLINQYDRSIYQYAQQYLAVVMQYLVDNKGYRKKRLERVKNNMEMYVNADSGTYNIEKMRQELLTEYGIYIPNGKERYVNE